jgi:hypothetical protein
VARTKAQGDEMIFNEYKDIVLRRLTARFPNVTLESEDLNHVCAEIKRMHGKGYTTDHAVQSLSYTEEFDPSLGEDYACVEINKIAEKYQQ